VERLSLVGPTVDLRDCAWPARATRPSDTSPSAWNVTVERLSVTGGTAAGGDCGESGSWSVAELAAALSDIGVRPRAGRVESLGMRIVPAGVPDGYFADLFVAATFGDGRLRVDSMSLRSPASDVSGAGVLRVPADSIAISDIDFELRAETLALDDLQPFTTALTTGGTVGAEARLRGSPQALDVEARLEPAGGGELTVSGRMTPTDAALLLYRGRASATDLDLAKVFAVAPAGVLNGVVDIDLSGPSMDALDGEVSADLRRTTTVDGAEAGARMEAAVSGGRAEITGSVYDADGTATVTGWARPHYI
jgi:hypothetical protein